MSCIDNSPSEINSGIEKITRAEQQHQNVALGNVKSIYGESFPLENGHPYEYKLFFIALPLNPFLCHFFACCAEVLLLFLTPKQNIC